MLKLDSKFQELFGRYSSVKVAKYVAFRNSSPHVYDEFVRLATQYKAAGRNKCSASLLGNVIRWNTDIGEIQGEYKVSNNWLPMMARELSVNDSSFKHFFSFRD